jgi:hypothetical protein
LRIDASANDLRRCQQVYGGFIGTTLTAALAGIDSFLIAKPHKNPAAHCFRNIMTEAKAVLVFL